jgi:phosphatidylserine decarboxylase
LAEKLGVLELILWNKDLLMKDYLGEAALPLEDWFREGDNGRRFAWEDAEVR